MLKNLLRDMLRRTLPKAGPEPGADLRGPQADFGRIRGLLEARDLAGAEASLARFSGAHGADFLWLRGELARLRGTSDSAQTFYRSALRHDLRHRASWMSLGVLFYRAGKLPLAHQHFRAVLALGPNDPEALNELGLVELALGNRTDARSTFEDLLDRHPDHGQAWNNLGLALAGQGQLEEACRAFRRALALNQDDSVAGANLGLACRDLNRPQEARQVFEAAARRDAQSPGIRVGLALALQDLGELDAARMALEQALGLAPGDRAALSALSALALRGGNAEEALALAERVLKVSPEHPEALLAKAHALLAQGAYREGWACYEARLRSRASPRRSYPLPHWTSAAPPLGRRILVYGEQGLGEQIMFASMLGEVRGQSEAALDCEPRLRALFARSFPGLRILQGTESRAELREQFDACLPIGSFARMYRNDAGSFPKHHGYLNPDPRRVAGWRARLGELGRGLKIGIAWRGGLASTGGALRSLDVDELAAIARQPGVHWINLQHDASAVELERFRASAPLLHDAAALADMDEAAALLAALDLAIAPCSTIVHLAGALGVPVWVLTPFAPAWRYRLQGESMPWYPSARLLRQSGPGGWREVLHSLSAGLDSLCAGRAVP